MKQNVGIVIEMTGDCKEGERFENLHKAERWIVIEKTIEIESFLVFFVVIRERERVSSWDMYVLYFLLLVCTRELCTTRIVQDCTQILIRIEDYQSCFGASKNCPPSGKPPTKSARNSPGDPQAPDGVEHWPGCRLHHEPHQAARRWCKHQCTDSPAPGYEEKPRNVIILSVSASRAEYFSEFKAQLENIQMNILGRLAHIANFVRFLVQDRPKNLQKHTSKLLKIPNNNKHYIAYSPKAWPCCHRTDII